MIDALTGRKLIVTVAILIIAVAVLIWKGDIPENFKGILEWVFTFFVAGNGLEHITNAVSAHAEAVVSAQVAAPQQPEPPAAAAVNLDPLDNKLNLLTSSQEQLHQGITQIIDSLRFIIIKTGIDKLPDPQPK
jgi:hypothetical protein